MKDQDRYNRNWEWDLWPRDLFCLLSWQISLVCRSPCPRSTHLDTFLYSDGSDRRRESSVQGDPETRPTPRVGLSDSRTRTFSPPPHQSFFLHLSYTYRLIVSLPWDVPFFGCLHVLPRDFTRDNVFQGVLISLVVHRSAAFRILDITAALEYVWPSPNPRLIRHSNSGEGTSWDTKSLSETFQWSPRLDKEGFDLTFHSEPAESKFNYTERIFLRSLDLRRNGY